MFSIRLGNIREIAQFDNTKTGWCNCPFLYSLYMLDFIIAGYTSRPHKKKKKKVTALALCIKVNNLEPDIIVFLGLQSRSQVHYSAWPICMLTLMPRQEDGVIGSER